MSYWISSVLAVLSAGQKHLIKKKKKALKFFLHIGCGNSVPLTLELPLPCGVQVNTELLQKLLPSSK